MGVGDFADLKLLVDWAVLTGLRVIQLLPINDTTTTATRDDSYPYSAISAFALHPLYLNLPLAGLPADDTYHAYCQSLNASPTVDYEVVLQQKLRLLHRLYDEQWTTLQATEAYQRFVRDNSDWLEPYAVFCLLRDLHHTADSRQWGSAATYSHRVVEQCRSRHPVAYNFYCFVQYHLDRQLREVSDYARRCGVVLKGDIPIGVSPTSVEVWQHAELFHLDEQAGAPPDAFAEQGQNWGFPTYNWERMATDDYSWWWRRLQHMARYFDAYRIDHVLGFFRIWEIPHPAVHGLLGHFRPAIPYAATTLQQLGFSADMTSYLVPYATDDVLHVCFSERAAEAKQRFFAQGYLLKEWRSQQYIIECRDPHVAPFREGLMRLADDVLFVEDGDRRGYYHPRIDARHTFAYQRLSEPLQRCFDRLHDDYFYHRHNDFWREEALRKLPVICSATSMLACGEDLGMIPACVPDVMTQLHILSLAIERMPKQQGARFGEPASDPYLSVSTTSTHDMSTLRGWWRESPDDAQYYYTHLLHLSGKAPEDCPPEVCRRILERTLHGNAMLAILPLQDWLSVSEVRRADPLAERINVPANPHHYWCYRLHLTLEQLLSADTLQTEIRRLVALRRNGTSVDTQ
jgi:4-alpha-glucanotransferase